MEYQDLTGGTVYLKPASFAKGDVIIEDATVRGSQEGKFGTELVMNKDGTKYVIKASGLLGYHLKEGKIKAGDVIRLVYDGKNKLKDGREAHGFKIQIAKADAQESLGF